MRRMKTLAACLVVSGFGAVGVGGGQENGKPADRGVLVVIDHAGKETKLKTWQFVAGTRRLGWLEAGTALEPQGKKGKKGGGPARETGPEALEFREENSTTYQDGILTFVPLESVKRIDYDNEAKTVTVTYLKAGEKGPEEGELKGTTKYVGINKLAIEAEADLGELGVAAIKFQGGSPKGIRAVVFPAPKAVPAPAGGKAILVARDKGKHEAAALKVLYTVGGGRTIVLDKLQFKATVKVPLDKLETLRHVEDNGKGGGGDFEVTLKGGAQHTLTLLKNVNPEDGTPAALQGLVGRVPAGYKLFPLHVLTELDLRGPRKEVRHEPDLVGDAQGQAARRPAAERRVGLLPDELRRAAGVLQPR
jgi:hypothetical protein